eukprot:5544007-Prymnesium_polylepis.1
MAQILSGADFVPDVDISFTRLKSNANGRRQIGVLSTQSGKGLYMATLLMMTWGVHEYREHTPW